MINFDITPSDIQVLVNEVRQLKLLILNQLPQVVLTTTTNISASKLDPNGNTQIGKNVVINNGAFNINYILDVNDGFVATYLKIGNGAVTFIAQSGRTLVLINGLSSMNGAIGSSATVSSVGTVDYLRITNI